MKSGKPEGETCFSGFLVYICSRFLNKEGTKSPLFFTMSDLKEEVIAWLSEAMEGSSFLLLEVTFNPKNQHLSVLIDGDEGVPISQCVELSRLLSKKLEEKFGEEHPYDFEVSSPGVDRPLQFARQYKKHVGRDLDLLLTDGKELGGKLKEVQDEHILLVENQKKANRKTMGKEHVIAFADIKRANVIIKF